MKKKAVFKPKSLHSDKLSMEINKYMVIRNSVTPSKLKLQKSLAKPIISPRCTKIKSGRRQKEKIRMSKHDKVGIKLILLF